MEIRLEQHNQFIDVYFICTSLLLQWAAKVAYNILPFSVLLSHQTCEVG